MPEQSIEPEVPLLRETAKQDEMIKPENAGVPLTGWKWNQHDGRGPQIPHFPSDRSPISEPTERERELMRLVEVAFAHPLETNIALGQEATKEGIAEGKKTRQNFGTLSDDAPVEIEKGEDAEGEVFVEDPKEYAVLLRLAYRKLGLSDSVSDEVCKHEFEHAEEIQKESGLSFRYGVSFLRDRRNKGLMGVRPFLRTTGTTTIGAYKKIVEKPSRLSEVDKAILGKDS